MPRLSRKKDPGGNRGCSNQSRTGRTAALSLVQAPKVEPATRLNSIDALRAESDMAGFIAWVKSKPPGVHATTNDRKRSPE